MLHWSFLVSSNLLMCLIYRLEHTFFEKYKTNPDPWPWQSDPKKWNDQLLKSIKQCFINNCLVLPVVIYIEGEVLGLQPEWSYSADEIASPIRLALTVLFCIMVEDLCFYFSHRLLHCKRFYSIIHKIHHEYKVSVGIAAEYAHPVEYILGNILPTVLGVKILRQNIHVTTAFVWFLIRAGETLDGHCGYQFSWSPFRLIPFSTE